MQELRPNVLAAQCSNIEEDFLLKRDESWRKSVKKKGLSRPALCWEISSEFLTRGEGRLLKEGGTGVWALGGWVGRGTFLHIVSCSRHTAGRELAPPRDIG